MQVIVKYDSSLLKNLHNLLGYSPTVHTFMDKFNDYVNSIKKSKRFLATEEAFSLDYNTTLSELRKSIWVDLDDKEFKLVENKLNILEICN